MAKTIFDAATKTERNTLQISSKSVAQIKAAATGDLIGNKIANETTGIASRKPTKFVKPD